MRLVKSKTNKIEESESAQEFWNRDLDLMPQSMSAFSQFHELEPSRIRSHMSESFQTEMLPEDTLPSRLNLEDLQPSTLVV